MKKTIYLLALAMIFTLSSCGGGKTDKESEKEETKAKWMDAYIEVIEAVLTGKADEGIQEKYGTLMMEAGTWATQWITLSACAMNDEYQKKFEAIQKKATDKLEGITDDLE